SLLSCEPHMLGFQQAIVAGLLQHDLVAAVPLGMRRAGHSAASIDERDGGARQRPAAFVGHYALHFATRWQTFGQVVAHYVSRPTQRPSPELSRDFIVLQRERAIHEDVLEANHRMFGIA